MAEETKTIVSSPKDYWISPNALSISLNALGEHDRIQASVASGAVIFCYIKDIAAFDFDAGHNFRKWPLVISPTYFNSTTEKYLYVAIPRSNTIGSEAMIVFPSQLLDIYGRAAVKRIVRDEQGNMLDPDGNITTDESKADYYYIAGDQVGSEDYYYIWLHGIITASGDNSANEREWAFDPKYDTGRLNTDETWGEVVTLEDLMIALRAKVNTDWFSRLFILHGYKMSVVYKTDPETGEPLIDEETGEPIVDIDEETGLPKTVKEDVVIQPNAWPQDGDGITITDIESKYGLWTNFFLSALGKNDAGGGGGGSDLFEPLLSINESGLGLPPQGLTGKVGIVWNYATQQYEWGETGGGGGGEGSVTSIGLTAPTGFTVTGSPITSSGTLGLAFADGYSLPTTAKQTLWDEAYNKRHEHSNLNVLEGITSEKVSAWDGVAAIIASPDSDTIINKWQEVVDFLNTYTEADTLAGLLGNKLDVSVAERDYLKKSDAANTYVTKTYFESLFELWNDNTTPSSKISVNTDISTFTAEQKAKLNIKSMFGFWTEQYISALGKNDEGGGGASTLSTLDDVQLTTPISNGHALIYNETLGKWVNGAAGMNVSELETYLSSKTLTVKNGNTTLGTWNPTAAGTIDIANGLSNYVTLATAQTITGVKTFTPQQIFTNGIKIGQYEIVPDTQNGGLHVKGGLYTDTFLSALGLNNSGGGGATLFEPLLSINESGLAAPADAQDGMTVVWDKNTHKWKYGATGGGTSLSLTPGCLLDTVDNYSYNDYIGQWSQQNIKGSAFLYDIGNANKVYYSASGNHIPNGIRLLWYDKNLFLIGKTDYGIQSEYSVPTGAVYVSFVLYYSITEIAYIEDGLSNIHFSFLGNDKIYISKDLEYPYGNPDTYNVNLDDYSDSYIEGVASDADYKKFFTDGRGKSICIPFSLFKYYDYVEIKQPSPSKAGISRIHFLKKEPKTNGETVEYSDFYTTNVQINKGNNTIFYKIPDDARYILIYAYWGNEDRRPERIALCTANSLGLDDMSKYDERVNTALRNPNQYQIKILHWNIGNYSNGGSETSINDSNYTAKRNSFKAFINKYKDHNVYINEWNSVFAKLSEGNVYAGPELWGYGYSYSSYVRCNDWDELGCVPTNTQISHKVGVLTSLAGMYLESGGYYSMPKPYVIYRHYIGGGSLYILHTHLPTRLSKQQHQTVFAEMVNIMSGYTNVIICGDLNLYDQSALETFTNAGYTIANNDEPTYPSSGSHYDWFVYKGNFTNVSFKVCKDAVDSGYSDGDTSHMLSDHWPIELILNYTGDSIVPAVRGANRFNPTTNVPQWHNGNEWFTFIKHDEVGTNDMTGLSGSFFFGGNDALQSGYDYVGFQAGNSLDKWQMVAIDSLKWRQNDSGGTNSTNWTAWKTILDSNNSGIVDGHKVKLNDTSIEVPVAYNIPTTGSFTSGYWHKLGDYVTAGDSSNLVLDIYDGNGYNSYAEQNSILRVVIKDGWQSTRAAADSVGVTIERFGVWAADMQISIVATDHNAGAVWIYFPWQYAAGTYVVSGNYNTWTHNSSTSSDTTTAPTTNQTKNSIGSHSYLYLDNAYTNSNVASATKLQTARLLWGNSFDGTADVNGDITITKTGTTPALTTVTNGTGTVRLAAYETNRGIWDASGSGWLIGTGPTSSNPNTFLMRGNVGIGKSSPSYKLDVDGTINCTSIRIGGYTITADTTNQGLRINSAGLYADTYISALGANSGGGGGGGVTLNEPLSSINNASLGSPSGTDMAIVWTGSAWGYKYVPDNGGGGGGSGTVTSIKITVPTGFSISPTSAITTSGTFAITFASGYSLPTTAKQSNWDTAYNNNHQHNNKSVLDDITSAMVTKWNNCVNASDVTTQLQNYAYISSGVIHIGDDSITPLTSHQTVSGTFWGKSWINGGTVNGSIEAGSNGGYIGGFDHIDLNTHASLLGYGGYIDFYYEGANSYTSRIIEKESGVLSINAPNVAGLLVGGYNGDYVQIGQIRIVYESSSNALRIENANNGGAANLYALGGISALGMSGNADGTISGNLIPSTNAKYSIGSSSYGWKELRLSQYGVSGRITIDGDGINIVSNEGGYLSGALYMVTGRMIVGTSDDDYAGFTFATEGTSYLSSKVSIGGTNSNSDKLYVNGTVRASSYNNSSDARLKNIISRENINIETIARAPIVRFTWKNTDDSRVHWGTLAQYWRSTEIGDIVEDGEYLAMDYAATALAGVISVARKVMTHEERIAALEAENERLRNEIETLKAA